MSMSLCFTNCWARRRKVARLRGYLRTDGDIIIWSTFWEAVSRLLTGATLDDIIGDAQTAAAVLDRYDK